MSFADWLTKYPGVQRLLQQDDDIVEGVSVEDRPLAERCRCICADCTEATATLAAIETRRQAGRALPSGMD